MNSFIKIITAVTISSTAYFACVRQVYCQSTETSSDGVPIVYDTEISAQESDGQALTPEIARRVIAVRPKLLDDRDILRRWLHAFGQGNRKSWPDPRIAELYKRLSGGTEFDEEGALADFRAFLKTQAVSKPLRLVRVRRVEVGRFDQSSGRFPLGIKPDSRNFDPQWSLSWGTSPTLEIDIANPKTIDGFPAAKPRAEAIAKRIRNWRLVDVAVTVRLDKFEAAGNADSTDVRAEGTIENISVYFMPERRGVRFGDLVTTIPVAEEAADVPPAQGPVRPGSDAWSARGVPMERDRVLVGLQNGPPEIAQGKTDALQRVLELALVREQPEIVAGIEEVFYASSNFLSPQQHAALFMKRASTRKAQRLLNDDAFQKKDIIDRFKRVYLQELIKTAPELPKKMIFTQEVYAAEYSFKDKAFPLSYSLSHNSDEKGLSWTLGPLMPELKTDLAAVPGRLAIEEKAARPIEDQLREKRERFGNRNVYLVMEIEARRIYAKSIPEHHQFGEITEEVPRHLTERQTVLEVHVESAALYADPDRKRLIYTLPITRPQDPVAAKPREPLPREAMPAVLRPSTWGLLGLAGRLGAGDDFLADAVRSSRAYKAADEFGQPALFNETFSRAKAETPASDASILIAGTITLGRHDGANAFAIEKGRFQGSGRGDGPQPEDDAIEIVTENPEALNSFTASAEFGRTIVADTPSREFKALIRVKPKSAVRKPSTIGAQAALTVEVEELFLVHPRDATKIFARSGVTPPSLGSSSPKGERSGQLAKTPAPERVMLTPETLTLLRIKHSGRDADDDTLKWLLQQRWIAENESDDYGVPPAPEPWGRFLPARYRQLTDADMARFLPSFREWNKRRLETLPAKLTLRRKSDYLSATFGHSASNYDEILAEIGVAPEAFNAGIPGAFAFESGSPGAVKYKGGILGLNARNSYDPPEAFIKVPDLPAPKVLNEHVLLIDLDIKQVVAKPMKSGSLPLLAIDAQPTEVRWWGDKSAIRPRVLVAKIAVATEPKSSAERAQVSTPPPPSVAKAKDEPAKNADSGFDVVGLKLGMRLGEAEKIVRDYMPDPTVVYVKPVNTNTLIAFGNGKVFVRDDKTEYIALLTVPERNSDQLIAIGRYVWGGVGAFTRSEIVDGLSAKFAHEPIRSDNLYFWGGANGPKNLDSPCYVQLGQQQGARWTDEAGQDADVKSLSPAGTGPDAKGPASMAWLGLRVLDTQRMNEYRDCKTSAAAFVPEFGAGVAEFMIWLTDTNDVVRTYTGAPRVTDQNAPGKPKVRF